MSLRKRCQAFIDALDDVDTVQKLMEFVMVETGRKAAPELEDTLPLCLYFQNDAEREDFIAMVKQINPGMTSRKVN